MFSFILSIHLLLILACLLYMRSNAKDAVLDGLACIIVGSMLWGAVGWGLIGHCWTTKVATWQEYNQVTEVHISDYTKNRYDHTYLGFENKDGTRFYENTTDALAKRVKVGDWVALDYTEKENMYHGGKAWEHNLNTEYLVNLPKPVEAKPITD